MRKTLLLFLFFSQICLQALAQFDSGAILGTVTDSTGAYVSSAKVTLTDINKSVSFSTVSTNEGNYQFPSIPIGRYKLTIEHSGFGSQISQIFDLAIGSRQRIDFHLQADTVRTAIEVNAQVPLMQTESSDRSQVMESTQIRELPLNGRAYSELVFLSAGIVRAPSSYGSSSSLREGSFNANGLRSTSNNFLLDGLDNNYFGTSNQGFSNQVVQPPPDAIAEFRVVTNNASAEFGRSGGATVNASLRSGTNAFHGSTWEFFRNTSLNAVGYFKPTFGKPRLNRNQFGFTFGGPIYKDKTFFFADYEGFRQVESSVQFASIPTADQRIGKLGIPVRNPFTGQVYADGSIPSGSIIRFAQGVMAALPATNGSGISNNYRTLYRIQDYRDKGDVKIDHYFSDRLRIFGRYSKSRFDVFDPGVIQGIAGGNGNGTQIVPIQSVAGGMTWTLSDKSILEARLGYSQSDAGKSPPLAGGPSMYDLFGIPGLPTEKQYTGGISSETLLGFTALGRQATSPQFQHPKLWDPKLSFTHILGAHSLKMGVEYQWLGVRTLDVNPILGRDVYSGLFSAPSGASLTATNQALYSLADFLFGARSQYQLVNPGYVNHRQQSGFLYIQDDYKFSKSLTLNLGLRYELVTPFYEKDNLLSNYDPKTNSMKLAKSGSIYERALVHMDTNNFAPRIGLAWSAIPKTVVHVGYAISYVNFNRTGTSYLAYNGPRFVLATVSQTPTTAGFRNTQDGFPSDFTSSSKFNPRTSTVQYIPEHSPSGMVQSWYLSTQRELPGNWLLDVGYVGNSAAHLILINDINQARPNAVNENSDVELRRPNMAFSSIAATLPAGTSSYNGLQVKVEKRTSSGFYFLNSFTWSKTIDTAAQAFDSSNGNGTSVQDVNNIRADRGISNYDRPFNNVTSLVYQLPMGHNGKFLSGASPVLNYLVGGWETNLILNMRSGEPVTLSYTPTTRQQVVPVISVLGRNSYRPNVSGPILMPKAKRTPLTYLDPSVVSVPNYWTPFGNVGRNTVRGYAYYQADFGLSKELPISERLHSQFRTEAFNLFNHSNFTAPNSSISSTAYGVITSTYAPRQIQFALKVQF